MSVDYSILCTVYRSKREPGMYVFVEQEIGLAKVPEALLARLGVTSQVMTFTLTPDRKLALSKAQDVLAAITAVGYFLQLPPDKQPVRFTLGE